MANAFKRLFIFLAVFIGIFYFSKNSYAATFNFDSYDLSATSSLSALDASYFGYSGSKCFATSSQSFSSPNSIFANPASTPLDSGGTGCAFTELATTTSITESSFYIYIPTLVNGEQSFIRLYNRYDSSTLNTLANVYIERNYSTNGDVMIKKETLPSQTKNLVAKGALTTGWHKLTLFYDDVNFKLSGQWDSGAISDEIDVATNTKSNLFNSWSFYKPLVGTMNLYLDDFKDGVAGDNINIIYPATGGIYSINDFYWHYQFNIKSLDYWTTYQFLNIDLGFFHETGGIVDATTTLSIYRYPMSDFVPLATYDVVLDNKDSFPTQSGAYQAIITLKGVYSDGSVDNLAYDTVDFAITSYDYKPPTAWCSDLCDDISSSTTSFWENAADSIFNSLVCAGRYLICYSFKPTSGSLEDIKTSYDDFKDTFPFNTFYSITDTMETAIASNTIASESFDIPMIRQTATSSEYYMMPVITSTTAASLMGESNASMMRTTLGYLFWAATAFGCLLIVW